MRDSNHWGIRFWCELELNFSTCPHKIGTASRDVPRQCLVSWRFRMMRYWMLATLLIGMTAGVSEARGRSRAVRYYGNTWQSSTPVYHNNTTPGVYSQSSYNSSQQFVHQASFNSAASSPIVTNASVQSYSVPGNSVPAYSGHNNSLQAWAEEEARMMASRGTCGHIRPAPMGCFVGVGCGTTCMGSGRLVAEASYQGKMVRVWQR